MNQTDSKDSKNSKETGANDALRERDTGYRIAVRTAAVAGVFSLVVCALLLYDYSPRRAEHPQDTAIFDALRLHMGQEPEDPKARESIRALDVQLRQEYFRQRTFAMTGAWLWLGGG